MEKSGGVDTRKDSTLHPELLKEVHEGARYANGIRVKQEPIEADPA
jgi:hypothetical protein